MTIKRIRSGGFYEDKIGYARAVVAGDFVFVSGCVAPGDHVPDGLIEQCAAALDVIRSTLENADSDMTRVVRVTYMIAPGEEFESCWPLLRQAFRDHPPAATMISCDLIDPKYKIEIEATALRQA